MIDYEPDKNLSVHITTGKPPRHGAPLKVHVQVADRLSGEVLVDFDVDANTWLDMITGAQYNVRAFVTSRLDRIGKKMVTDVVTVPKEITEDAPGRGLSRGEAEVEAWIAEQDWPEWEEFRPRNTNSGWEVVRARWQS